MGYRSVMPTVKSLPVRDPPGKDFRRSLPALQRIADTSKAYSTAKHIHIPVYVPNRRTPKPFGKHNKVGPSVTPKQLVKPGLYDVTHKKINKSINTCSSAPYDIGKHKSKYPTIHKEHKEYRKQSTILKNSCTVLNKQAPSKTDENYCDGNTNNNNNGPSRYKWKKGRVGVMETDASVMESDTCTTDLGQSYTDHVEIDRSYKMVRNNKATSDNTQERVKDGLYQAFRRGDEKAMLTLAVPTFIDQYKKTNTRRKINPRQNHPQKHTQNNVQKHTQNNVHNNVQKLVSVKSLKLFENVIKGTVHIFTLHVLLNNNLIRYR